MSKSKTKRQHRELKRESARKLAVSHRRAAAAAAASTAPRNPPAKKHKPNAPKTDTTTPNAVTPTTPATKPKSKPIQASQKHDIPFGTYDRILLVGEGDFSFTRSLAIEHGCANVTGTSYDSLETVREKYSRFASIQEELEGLVPPVPLHHGIDATKVASYKLKPAEEEDAEDEDRSEGKGKGIWDTVAFMFPHTGGLSTDVNRQARANQKLIVDFFSSCLTSSNTSSTPASTSNPPAPAPRPPLSDSTPSTKRPRHQPLPFLRPGGKIIVSLFEGEQYDRWCIRNLARHVGLKVRESYGFDWDQYPGYRHVRTLGEIEGGGGWKGEEREARLFVFEKADEGGEEGGKAKKRGKKRGRGADDGSESEGE